MSTFWTMYTRATVVSTRCFYFFRSPPHLFLNRKLSSVTNAPQFSKYLNRKYIRAFNASTHLAGALFLCFCTGHNMIIDYWDQTEILLKWNVMSSTYISRNDWLLLVHICYNHECPTLMLVQLTARLVSVLVSQNPRFDSIVSLMTNSWGRRFY